MVRAWFLLVFAASGAAALVYEVAWTRLLTLQVGHGVAAASTVLAAFMGGLAAGAALAGRLGHRLAPAHALVVYALLEVAIAALALALPLALAAFEPLLVAAYADGDGALFALVRIGSSLALLSIPAAAMGATFPVAARWMVRQPAEAAADTGLLYAANTVGAAAGAALAGFVLLPALGLSGTTRVGLALNLAAAAGALAIIGRPVPAPPAAGPPPARAVRRRRPAAPPPGGEPATAARRGQPWVSALALGLSGFSSLALQVVWMRVLALILGPTTYAFSVIVATFITGIAIGSALGSRLAARAREPLVGLAVCLAASVTLGLAAAGFVDRGLLLAAEAAAHPGATFEGVLLRQVTITAGLLAPMTLAFGAAFPFAIAAGARPDRRLIADVGVIYAVNTAGAIAGALAAGFALIPWLGLDGTLRVVALVGAAGAAGLALAAGLGRRGRLTAAAAALAALVGTVGMPRWDPLLLSSGAYKYAAPLDGLDLPATLGAGHLLYYREGAHATVTVRDLAGTRSLAIDGKVDASNAGDMLTQRLLAHVPLLLHHNPREIAIIGLGSGVTLGSALRHPIARATSLEISPEVVEASRLFDAYSGGPLADRRTRLVVGDGRSHLRLTTRRYDVIVSEPSNPWMAGIASLFTREFFEAARARLAPGGIFCEWAHTYDISTADLRSIVATFLSVFPDGTLWLVGDADVLLVGSTAPLALGFASVADAWARAGVAEDLAEVGARDPFAVLSLLVAAGPRLAAWAEGAPIQTDDRLALEFSGPRALFAAEATDHAGALRALADDGARPQAIADLVAAAGADAWRDRGWMLLRAEGHRAAFDDFVRAVGLDAGDARALDGLLQAAVSGGHLDRAEALLGGLTDGPSRAPAMLALSRLFAGRGAYDDAVRLPLALIEEGSEPVAALEQLASVLSDTGDRERLAPIVARLQAEAPGSEAANYYAGVLRFLQGRPDLAVEEARGLIAANGGSARAQNLLGASLASLGRRDEARTAFLASLELDPRDPAVYVNLGALALESGDGRAAVRYFAEALTIDPASEAARQGLAEARARR